MGAASCCFHPPAPLTSARGASALNHRCTGSGSRPARSGDACLRCRSRRDEARNAEQVASSAHQAAGERVRSMRVAGRRSLIRPPARFALAGPCRAAALYELRRGRNCSDDRRRWVHRSQHAASVRSLLARAGANIDDDSVRDILRAVDPDQAVSCSRRQGPRAPERRTFFRPRSSAWSRSLSP